MEREHQDRRGFLRLLVGGVAAAAAVRTFPFRVFSMPSTPVLATISQYADYVNFSKMALGIEWDAMELRIARRLAQGQARELESWMRLTGHEWIRLTNHESRITRHGVL